MISAKDIFVFWNHETHSEEAEQLGILTVQNIRNKEVFHFEFDTNWLRKHPQQRLDPELQLYAGPQFTNRMNFGLFMDSAPDRWGRKLMRRREVIRSRKSGEKPRCLLESDYLLGVYDETRMGALRFKLSMDGEFQNNETSMAAPPWTYLRRLEEASRHIDNDLLSTEEEKWLSVLLAPGSSLGGARPKASVSAVDGTLWIAKFPNRNDEINTSAWEYATMKMAHDAGITVPDIKLETYSNNGSTFLCRRFDRHGKARIHFASAMTLLGKSDGDNVDSGCSYLDIVEFISQNSKCPSRDLQELWRRIVFSIAVSNTDDHLRNHGFLLGCNGWELSPAYDINPNPDGHGLSLNITSDDNSLDFSLALEVAPFFKLNVVKANAILGDVRRVVSNWQNYAKMAGISYRETETMRPAFQWK